MRRTQINRMLRRLELWREAQEYCKERFIEECKNLSLDQAQLENAFAWFSLGWDAGRNQ